MYTNFNQANNLNLGKKFRFSRENNSNSSITGITKKKATRCKSGGTNNPNLGNLHYENKYLNFNYDGFLNNQNVNKDIKSNKDLSQTKMSYKPMLINDKENENKSKKSNVQTIFSSKSKYMNNNSKFQKKTTVKNGPITIDAKNIIYNQKIGFDNNYKNDKNDISYFNLKEKQNAFQKKKDENYNPNRNNSIENIMNPIKLKNDEIKPEAFSNKNFDGDIYKLMNILKEKKKNNLECNLNFNENTKINEQLNEIKELKKSNEQYKLIIQGKDKEINSLKQNNEQYESIINEKNNGIYSLKQKIIELNKNNEKYQLIIKEKDNEINSLKNNEKYELIINKKDQEINYLKQIINELEKNNKKYEVLFKEKDNEIKGLQQKINEANIIIKQCIIFKNKDQELKNKEIEINQREEEFNQKMNFLVK